jgi:hypothetical protein
MRMMEDILGPFTNTFLVVYLDEFFIYNIYNKFCTSCDNTSYTPTWKNSPSTWTGSITWDRSLIRIVYMWIQPRSKSFMTGHPQPHSLSFLGLAIFYHRFVFGFSHIAWVLRQVTWGGRKDKFMWGQSQQQAFDDLKQRLCSTPVLSLSNLQEPFEIEDICLRLFSGHRSHSA